MWNSLNWEVISSEKELEATLFNASFVRTLSLQIMIPNFLILIVGIITIVFGTLIYDQYCTHFSEWCSLPTSDAQRNLLDNKFYCDLHEA